MTTEGGDKLRVAVVTRHCSPNTASRDVSSMRSPWRRCAASAALASVIMPATVAAGVTSLVMAGSRWCTELLSQIALQKKNY